MVIGGLQANTRYEFRVAGFTAKGRGEFSRQEHVMTEPNTPAKPLKFTVLKEEVDGKPAIRVRWHLPANHTVDKYK